MNNFNHNTESYELFLQASGLAESCLHLYHNKSRGETSQYYLLKVEEYLGTMQKLLNELKEQTT